jgi:two-component system chemotaxis sensor kinase CheA
VSDSPDERGAELRELFFETSQELLQALNEESLKLEKNPGDEEIVRSIRRTVHTLKGDSAACGLRELSELAHQFEDALSLETAAAHGALAEIAFAAADVFAAMLAAYHSGGPIPAGDPLRNRIKELTSAPAAKKLRRKKKVAEAIVEPRRHWTDSEKQAMAQAQASGLALYDVVVKIDPHCAMPIAARQLIQNAISRVGQVLVVRPDANSPAATKQVEFVVGSSQSEEQIATKSRIPTIACEASVILIAAAKSAKSSATLGAAAMPVAPTLPASVSAPTNTVLAETITADIASAETVPADRTPANTTPAKKAPVDQSSAATLEAKSSPVDAYASTSEPPTPATPENILRVDAGRIDNVLNLVGELIIGKSMLQQALNEFSKHYPKEALRGKFADAMAFQARVLNDLQRSVMKIRMVPVDQLFRRFPRIVRDVARQCEREVDLELSGQETDLDKGILDAIAEPLTHLVRNAVSHGIEPPEQRRSLGKPPHGKIRLHALHQGNQVVVEISDDGGGIDAQKIRAKGTELGLITREEASRMSDAEALELIFRPGFSTADVVTEVSGRGVGMDVVQSVLHRLKATIHIETHPGRGTTFRLKLPLTLAIIKALMFWVEQRLYAIPLNAVNQIARTTEAEVHQVDNYEVLQLRNQVLPLLRLGRRGAVEGDRKSNKLFVLVITVGEKKYGLIVDALEGEEELVIKALDDQTFSTDLVNGASILGDGKVVLILNLLAVVEHVSRSSPEKAGLSSSGLLLNHADRARLTLSAAGGQA